MFKKKTETYQTTHYPPTGDKGNEYYSIQGLLNVNADINICVGGREAGKSTEAATTLMMYDAMKNGNKFIFVRNLQSEITQQRIYSYFGCVRFDAYPELEEYNNIYVSIKKEIFLRKINDNNEVVDEVLVGIAYSIENALQNKSMTLPKNVYNKMVIEEFANNYIKWRDYFDRYTALVSTFQRWHDDFKVYLFANKVNRNNIFFVKYQVGDLEKHPLDEIRIIKLMSNPPVYRADGTQLFSRIAVENVKNLTEPSTLLMGDGIQNNTSGDDFEAQLHDLIDYRITRTELKRFYISADNITFKVTLMKNRKNEHWFEVNYTKKIPSKARVISKDFSKNKYWTKSFIPKNNKEKKLFDLLLNEKRILFHSNLCGTEFYRELDNLK